MKTAVEQLVQEINKLTGLNIAMDEPCVIQAKAMEKEQIINTFKNGDCNGTFETINAEQYYNKTFKSE